MSLIAFKSIFAIIFIYGIFASQSKKTDLYAKLMNKKLELGLLEKTFSFIQLNRPITDNDSPSNFYNEDEHFETKITKLPVVGKVSNEPWSSYHWPARYGYISVRYNINERNSMGKFNFDVNNFTEFYNLTKSVNFYSQPEDYNNLMASNPSTEQIEHYINENFSPSEKFDFYLGDYNFTLTNFLKNLALNIDSQVDTEVPDWAGLSNGWALSATLYDKPKGYVSLLSADNTTRIQFLPKDIEALAAVFWSSINYKSNYIGSVCSSYGANSSNSDIDSGLFTNTDCFEINPASLLIVLANQIGINSTNVIFDNASDPEVWNYPIKNYTISYFNILNNTVSNNLGVSAVTLQKAKTSNDPAVKLTLKNANDSTQYLIGVKITISFDTVTFPYHFTYPTQNYEYTDSYSAIIELDKNYAAIGGEWMSNHHPNFIWKIDTSEQITSCCDYVTKFNGTLTQNTIESALLSTQQGQVTKAIIDYLMNTKNQIVDSSNTSSDTSRSSNTNSNNSNNYPTAPVNNNNNNNSSSRPSNTSTGTSTTPANNSNGSRTPSTTPTTNANNPIINSSNSFTPNTFYYGSMNNSPRADGSRSLGPQPTTNTASNGFNPNSYNTVSNNYLDSIRSMLSSNSNPFNNAGNNYFSGNADISSSNGRRNSNSNSYLGNTFDVIRGFYNNNNDNLYSSSNDDSFYDNY